ncbi:unnamed protein product [Taenia asiatica]|uniref:Uncharacterized protein n=1 Tax=Taenia asiatica TaxID=60517 RepID=A0A0R3VXK1_TAEAS|nr:unnamed protein product [Taenia asiatica]
MLAEAKSPVAAPSTPSKGVRALSSHLELSPTSPVINGLRQSRIAFKVQRTKTNSWLIVPNNENVATALPVSEPKSGADAPVQLPKPQRGSAGRRLKQTLLTEKPQPVEPSRQSTKDVQKFVKPTRSRQTATRRSVSVSDPPSASGERQRHQEPKACSLSPKKQLRANSPMLKAKTAATRFQQTQLSNFGIRRTARQSAKVMQVTHGIIFNDGTIYFDSLGVEQFAFQIFISMSSQLRMFRY